MIKGIDCAAPLTAEKARIFKDLGYEFVGRYFCPDTKGNWKRLNKPEAEAISAAGLRMLCVWETTAARAGEGMTAGAVDGARAYNQALELDMPTDGVIYFAVDYDAQKEDFDAVEAYLRAASQQTGPYKIGVYGGYRLVEAMHERFGDILAYWQCVAWSYGHISPCHNVYQGEWNVYISEADHTVDINICPDMDAAGLWNYEEDEMKPTEENYEVFKQFMDRYEKEKRELPPSDYAQVSCAKGVECGLFSDGNGDGMVDEPQGYVKRQELAVVMDRAGLLEGR